MKKRILAAMLWFYVGWYAGALLAEFIGISQVFGPILGAAAAALVAGDPRHLIWDRRVTDQQPVSSPDRLPEPA